MTLPGKPILLIDPPAGVGRHDYFDRLDARPDRHRAFGLRSQAEIDALPEVAQHSDVRQPIVYDPRLDAAWLRFYPPVSADIKGRRVPLDAITGSFLLTWDFRFDEGFRWLGPGHMARHKTWRLDPGSWLQVRTDYRHTADKEGKFSEVFISMPGKRFTVPGQSWRTVDDQTNPRNFKAWYGEMLQPRVGEFFAEPDTWTRLWLYVQDYDQATCFISAWAADERRDPVQLLDKVALFPNGERRLNEWFLEYDTSADSGKLPTAWIHAWNRNMVALKGLSLAEAVSLLERP